MNFCVLRCSAKLCDLKMSQAYVREKIGPIQGMVLYCRLVGYRGRKASLVFQAVCYTLEIPTVKVDKEASPALLILQFTVSEGKDSLLQPLFLYVLSTGKM